MTNLSRKLEELAEKAGTDPAKTIVNVDIANVWNWVKGSPVNDNMRQKKDSDIPPSDKVSNQHVSMEMLADFFEGEELIQEVRIFAPKVFLNQDDLKKLSYWAEKNTPNLYSQIKDMDQATQAYMSALARIFITLIHGKSIDQIFEPEVRPFVRILLRLERTLNRMNAFRGVAKAKYLTRSAIGKIRPLRTAQDHHKEAKDIAVAAETIASEAATADALDLKVDLDVNEIVRNVQRAEGILHRLQTDYPNPDFDTVLAKLKDVVSMARRLSSTLEARERTVARLKDIHNLQQDSAEKILRALDAPGNYTKCDVDPLIYAKSLSKTTLNRFDNQVIFSGDGDFKYLYDELRENGVGVMVVSPYRSLNGVIRDMASSNSDMMVYDPSGENIWKK